MIKNYPFNNSVRLTHLIDLYSKYLLLNPIKKSANSFGDYIKSLEFNKAGSPFYGVSCICPGILSKKLNKKCVPDKSIFSKDMTVWKYVVSYNKEHGAYSNLNDSRQDSQPSCYLSEIESKRKKELEKLSHICKVKCSNNLISDEIKNLRSQVDFYQAKLGAAISMLNDIEEYASLANKCEDNRPELYRRVRACHKSGDLPYSDFERLCEEFEINDDVIHDYISNDRVRYAFKPYIICKYA